MIDLQDIDLESESIDVLLSPHVLEHVPDTDRALSEIYRVLAPGGRMYLQVPILQAATARPTTPEFHGDNTPVEWRFGPDLTKRLRQHGFATRILCTHGFHRHVADGGRHWPDPWSPEFDVESVLTSMSVGDLEPIADYEISRRVAFQPSYMFLTWECLKAEA
jgi:SAM-dependent methyltransferase